MFERLCVTKLRVKELCLCVCDQTACVCVCDKTVGDKVGCVRKRQNVVRDTVACERDVYEKLPVTKLCVCV